MAGSVWGIDIGQCGLKALRGRLATDGETLEVESFDYVEYPQILSQADANPDELVREALKTFLARNTLRGDKVAISLPGQAGLSRFIKLPPVEPKQLPALVGFEAKQQIPFDLEDVVWDYQQMPGCDGSSNDDDDLPMENEVGLFAIKRDQLLRATRPLIDAEVELDYVQLAPIAIYNAIVFDQLPHQDDEENPIDRNDWICILSMGTDTSDLVLTNGYRVWQRSIPLGGNHFTKQITSEMKLTFAKAELLKRNARDAAEAKAIFQAMRPTFKDLVTEIQRSLGYFSSLDRDAKITKIVALGNAMKLPGLAQYIEKNTDFPVTRLEKFERLTGPDIDVPAFKENLLAFPVCYGLVLQGTGAAKLRTNLVPGEIIRQRLIRRKKPWATAIAASLLLAMAFNYFFNWRAWYDVNNDRPVNGITWQDSKSRAEQLASQSSTFKNHDTEQQTELARLDELGEAAVGSADGRLLWLELLKAITAALPRDEDLAKGTIASLDQKPLGERVEIYIDSIESEYFTDLSSEWFAANGIAEKYQQMQADRQVSSGDNETGQQVEPEQVADAEVDPDVTEETDGEVAFSGDVPTVEGNGWVIEVKGHHFHHNGKRVTGTDYVRKHLIDQLEVGTVMLPVEPGSDEMMAFEVPELGILFPVEITGNINPRFEIPNPKYDAVANASDSRRGAEQNPRQTRRRRRVPPGNPKSGESKEKPTINEPAYEFTIQFCWKQISAKERLENRRKATEAESAEEEF